MNKWILQYTVYTLTVLNLIFILRRNGRSLYTEISKKNKTIYKITFSSSLLEKENAKTSQHYQDPAEKIETFLLGDFPRMYYTVT